MSALSRITPSLDKLAVSTAGVCAVHCMFLPLIVGFFPAVGATFFGEEAFHQMLLWLVIPLSLFALFLGCRQHKSWLVAALGAIGMAVLVMAAILGHDGLGESGERIATLIGSCFIAAGHVRNFTLCRRVNCDH